MKKQAIKSLAAVNLQVVTKVATELASLKTDITTLEVKNELRSRGYFVNQKEVSDFMNEMFEDPNQNEWDFKANGNHRIYTYNPFLKAATKNTGPQFQSSVFLKLGGSKNYKGKKRPALTPLKKSVIGCWEVTDIKSLNEVFYDSSNSRDAVRCDYAKLNKVSFNDVRAKKVK